MNFSFYIARRYLFSKKSHNAINVISGISVCGVALATLALVCTLSVFNGFQSLVSDYFTAFDPELKITPVTGKVFDGQDPKIQALRSMPEIEVVSESLEDNAMVQYKGRQAMAVIKGVEDNFDRLTPIDSILFGRGDLLLGAGDARLVQIPVDAAARLPAAGADGLVEGRDLRHAGHLQNSCDFTSILSELLQKSRR